MWTIHGILYWISLILFAVYLFILLVVGITSLWVHALCLISIVMFVVSIRIILKELKELWSVE